MSKASVNPERRTRRPQHSDDKLLNAARRVFARDGLRAATVGDIAAAAGTTKPTFYARFGSKDELYETTLRREAEALTDHLFAAYADVGTMAMSDFVRRAVDAWFAFAAERPDGLQLLFFADAAGAAAITAETAARIEDQITIAIGNYLNHPPGAGAKLLATMIVGSCSNAARHVLTNEDLDAARAAELTTTFLVAAMRGTDPALLD